MDRHSLKVLFLLTVCITFAGCVTGSSVSGIKKGHIEAVKKIPVEFEKITFAPPPRTLDASVLKLIDQYKVIPSSRAACAKPHQKLSREDISRMASGVSNEYFVLDAAMEEFLNGNFDLAVQMGRAAAGDGSFGHRAAICASMLAFFLAESGDFKSAQQTLDSAGRSYSSSKGGREDIYNVTEFSYNFARASIANARGDAETAQLYYFRALVPAQTVALRSEGRWREGAVQIGLARAFIWSGQLLAAENWAREAITLLHIHSVGGAMTREYRFLPHGLITYSDILFEQGRFEEAEKTARCTLNMLLDQCVPKDSLIRARARQTLARTLLARGRWKEALDQFETIKKDMITDPESFKRNFGTSRDWGLSLLRAGRTDEALALLDSALVRTRQRYGPDHYAVAEVEGLKGMACLEMGQRQEAIAWFERSVPKLLEKWRDKDGESMNQSGRRSRLELIVDAYIESLIGSGSSDNAAKAFGVAGALQSQTVARSLASSAARFSVSDKDLMDLIRKRQDLELKLAAVQNRLTGVLQSPAKLQNTEVKKALFRETQNVGLAVKSLDEVIKRRFSDYDSIVNPGVISAAQVRNTLHAGEALIYIFSGRKKTYTWALSKDGAMSFHSSGLSEKKIAEVVGRLRIAVDPEDFNTLGDIPAFDLKTAYDLYVKLLKPVEAGWKNARRLLVVTPGPLGQIPLSILPFAPAGRETKNGALFSNYKAVPWLVRNHSVTVLPSVAALATLRSLPPGKKERKALAGFGDPWFSKEQVLFAQAPESIRPKARGALRRRSIRIVQDASLDDLALAKAGLEMLAPLPDTAEELRSIGLALSADLHQDVFLGTQASERRVKTMDLSDRRILVFATHGLVPGDLDGLVQPALALSSPELAGDLENDGLLTMGEIMGLKLDADWVVLSACNTAAGNGTGAEAISGLGQSFFYAGARSLLATSWPVETTSAKALTTALFTRMASQPDLDRAEALRQTIIEIMDSPEKNGYCYAHPIFWAPYILVGDSR